MKKRKCYLTEESRQKGLSKSRESAKAAKEQRKKQYENESKLCNCCKKPLSYKQRNNKYCSKSCAAKVNNIGITRHGINRDKACEYCGKTTNNYKYCSSKCFNKHDWEKKKETIEKNGFISVGKTNNPYLAKKYLDDTREYKCEICGETEWMGQKIPLVLDHINGNPGDWRLENLQRVCGNCNMQLPTFAGRNIGKSGAGRPYRMKRYYEGKSW